MKAIRFHRYGDPGVLRWEDAPDPHPRRGEIRVRVHAAALNPKDVLIRRGKVRLLTPGFPQLSGQDVAGVVDAIGKGVRAFEVGDEVYGMIPRMGAGACAELVALPHRACARKPPGATMIEAAAVPLAAMTALQALRDLAHLRRGDDVVLNGASGGVGTFAIQIAKILGARVSVVCSARNESFVRELGADEVLPYDEQPLLDSGRRFDVVFDIFGSAPFEQARHLLRERGRYVTTIPRLATMARDIVSRLTGAGPRVVLVDPDTRDLHLLAQWIDTGAFRPVVDRVFPITEAASAHAYVETKRARGKVVLRLPAGRAGEP
ncbi:MAG: NAD(P)-dependent alcohol dehydrogenase [Deltaproteobacteria bacterium]|nr:NAD(P)-dependent alcohol dehydrogenase [Deltaproteobacteria bacterium]